MTAQNFFYRIVWLPFYTGSTDSLLLQGDESIVSEQFDADTTGMRVIIRVDQGEVSSDD